MPDVEAAQVWSAHLFLERSQWLSPAEIAAGQLTQLRRLLRHCADHVPHYRELFASIGFVPADAMSWDDFRRLPTLGRRTVSERPDALHAGWLPPGTRRTGSGRTSGTSGVPVVVQHTNIGQQWWVAFTLRDVAWSGRDIGATLAIIRPTGATGPALERLLGGVALPRGSGPIARVVETGQRHLMDIHQDPRQQLEWLARVAPDYLLSFPSNVAFLASLAREDGIRLPTLRGIHVLGEELTDDARASIDAAFGVPVWDMYSCTEAGVVASPCPDGHGLHVHAENVIVEVLDEAGRPCAPGDTGRIVLTTLHNFLMPFVRYDLMDEAEVGPTRCACGRGLPALRHVRGRRRPVVRLPGGRATNSSGLALAIMAVGGFRQFQVVQRTLDHFVVRLVPAHAWTAEHGDRIAAAARQQLDPRVRVDVVALERIERPPGGKLHSFVTELAIDGPRP